jgi:hypothetical protein
MVLESYPAGSDGDPASFSDSNEQASAAFSMQSLQIRDPAGWQQMFGYTKAWYTREIKMGLGQFASVLPRPMTQEEGDALATHITTKLDVATIRAPVAFCAAALMTWRGRRTFRFPFYQPSTSFNQFIFPNHPRVKPFIEGKTAVNIWHVARFNAYLLASWVVIGIPTLSVSGTVMMKDTLSDPKLRQLFRELGANQAAMEMNRVMEKVNNSSDSEATIPAVTAKLLRIQNRIKTLKQQEGKIENKLDHMENSESNQPKGERPGFRADMLRKELEAIKSTQEPLREQEATFRQLLETLQNRAANEDRRNDSGADSRNQEWSSQQDYDNSVSPGDQSPSPSPPVRSYGWGSRPPAPPPQQEPTRDDWNPLDEDEDDASPVAGDYESTQSSTASGGSAWDRVRAQARNSSPTRRSAAGTPATTQTGQDTSSQESFSYTREDEERSIAKSQAQKNFDEMLERERRGGGESEGNRWSRR